MPSSPPGLKIEFRLERSIDVSSSSLGRNPSHAPCVRSWRHAGSNAVKELASSAHSGHPRLVYKLVLTASHVGLLLMGRVGRPVPESMQRAARAVSCWKASAVGHTAVVGRQAWLGASKNVLQVDGASARQ